MISMYQISAWAYPDLRGEDMRRRICFLVLLLGMCVMPVRADTVRWVEFDVPYESLRYAMERDIATFEQEKHLR